MNLKSITMYNKYDNAYRFSLASNRIPKLDCPYCRAKKHWQRYLDKETGEPLPDEYGRCDNEEKCGQSLNPYTDGYAKIVEEREKGIFTDRKPTPRVLPKTTITKPSPVFFNFNIFKKTLATERYIENEFIQNLLHNVPYPLDIKDVTKTIELYRLGTIVKGDRKGAITFPFIDINQNVRTIQVKRFDNNNHTIATDFLHSMLERNYKQKNKPLPTWLQRYLNQDRRVSCLFGEHLLSMYPTGSVVLVEAPKTAIYCQLYFQSLDVAKDWIFLAVYNKSSFTLDRVQVLKGRTIYVFPDLSKDGGTFQEWSEKANEFEKRIPNTKFVVYDFLENFATEEQRDKGADIADVIIQFDWRTFRNDNAKPSIDKSKVESLSNIQKPKPLPLPWQHLNKIPLELKQEVISLRSEGKSIEEILIHFKGELNKQEVKLILNPSMNRV